MWRSLARRAQDSGRLLARGFDALTPLHKKALHDHLSAASVATTCLCDTQKATFEQQVFSWTAALRNAVAAVSQCWIRSLVKLADAKAKKLENATAKLRAVHWRSRVGAVAEPGASACPTKFAYQWVRGLTG